MLIGWVVPQQLSLRYSRSPLKGGQISKLALALNEVSVRKLRIFSGQTEKWLPHPRKAAGAQITQSWHREVVTINNNTGPLRSGNWNEYNLNPLTRIHWRASLVKYYIFFWNVAVARNREVSCVVQSAKILLLSSRISLSALSQCEGSMSRRRSPQGLEIGDTTWFEGSLQGC
jgi:hypothetical protein